jgi:TonB-linked SusC/RagA family outer membrane protein
MQMNRIIKTLVLSCFILGFGLTANAQQKITGVVTDESGVSLPGVTVLVIGSNTASITNQNGMYSINAVEGTVLHFSYIGMLTQQITITNKTEVNIVLEQDAIGLEEVQVVGYGTQKKISITGSVSSIGSDELLKSPQASITNALAGKITGVSAIQNTGEPGADEANLFIRGIATLNDASPLIIVDGVERPFSQLDPEEVESISILKDASATAVYGVRGANGVIIVTTKRGEKGKPKISVSSSLGFQEPTMMLDKANSYIYAMGMNERDINDGQTDMSKLKFSPEQLETFENGGNLLYPDTDWYEYMFNDYAMQSKSNIGISGGTDRVRYFVSLGYLSQNGQLKELDQRFDQNFRFDRFNYRSNLDIDITKSTLLKVTLGGRNEMRRTPKDVDNDMWKTANWAQPMSGSGIVDGKWITSSKDNINLNLIDPLRSFFGQGSANNTSIHLNMDIDIIQKLDFVTQGLRARVKGSYNTDYMHNKKFWSYPEKYEAIVWPEAISDENPDGVILRKIADQGIIWASENTGQGRNSYMEAALDYNRKFGFHEVGGLVLYNQRVVHYPGGLYNDIPRAILGIVSRVTYNYKTKYLADLNMGYNGSENFPEESRFGFFPSASLGWIISEESFMKNIEFIEYMKIRGSYGLVGNDRLGSSRFLYLPDSWNYNARGYSFGDDNPILQQGAQELRIGNPFITWETAIKRNIGFDAAFFNGKLKTTFDYFHENREDILITRSTAPNFIGANLPVVNMGEVENKGYEVELDWHQKAGTDFSYGISVNMSYAQNKILFKDEVPQPEDYLYETGKPVGQPFGYITDGFFPEEINTTLDDNYNEQGGIRHPGDFIYKDLNNDGVIDDLDKQAIGYSSRIPEYNLGANLWINWKGLDLSLTFSGVKNTSRSLPYTFREPYGGQDFGLFTYLYDGRWTPETAETAIYSRFASGDINYRDSDVFIVDASYLRLKNLTIGYTVNSALLKSAGISNVRIYLNGYNLLTFSKFNYYDPESNPGSAGLYPLIKMYNMGLKFNF